jgi:hypothetical protein
MGYAGILLLIIPQLFLILVSILFIITFAAIYIMKWIVKLSKEEIVNRKGSLLPLAFSAWGCNIIALAASLGIMDIVSFSIPFFDGIHSEWGIAFANAYVPALIYIICLALLHAALLLFSHFAFKKRITIRPKRIKMLTVFIVSSVLVWAFIMCFGFQLL